MEREQTGSSGQGHYCGGIIALHWLMLLLFIGVYATVELHEIYEQSRTGDLFMFWHFQFGYAIFALVWIRLILRLASRVPPADPNLPALMQQLARGMRILLYLLMILMPVTGWLTLGAEGHESTFLGLNVPILSGLGHSFGEIVEEVHEIVGIAGYFLIGLHTLAALFHHYVLRDNTMKRILPRMEYQ
ncbi:MAG: cytochrome b [Gammaproteobacteria bacterium]|nr:cytochrome b [Gammaproteobacteria bacterium]